MAEQNENIQINIPTNGTTVLATAGKYCERNIALNVNVAVPEPDAKIIDVDELPTTDIDDSVYYRMDGKLYKHRAETAVGTWVLHTTISITPNEYTYQVTGSFCNKSIKEIYLEGTNPFSSPFVARYVDNNELAFAYSTYDPESGFITGETSGSIWRSTGDLYEELAPTEENRTVTITGGDDATDPYLISWLEENAVRQGDNSDWDCYLVPSGSVEITENGTVDVADKKEVVVNVPSNVPAVIGEDGADTSVILTAENVGKVYSFDNDLYMVENDEGTYKFRLYARSNPNINFAEGTWIFDDNAISEWFYTLCEYPLPQRFQSDGCDWYGFGANAETGYIYYYKDWPSVEGASTTNVFSMTDGWVDEAYKSVIFGFGEVKDILTSSATKISDD